MSPYLFGLAAVLVIARYVNHVWQPASRNERVIFASITVVASTVAFVALYRNLETFRWTPVLVWAAAGFVGWYAPEIVRECGRLFYVLTSRTMARIAPVLPVIFAVIALVTIFLFNPDLGLNLAGYVALAVVVYTMIVTTYRISKKKPAQKRRRRH